MLTSVMPTQTPQAAKPSCIYGPVKSWRYGQSLGVDLLREVSTCSFNCIYCQLGDIVQKTNERKVYVPTAEIIADFEASNWQQADIITFSGSGEPTLALNLKDVLSEFRKRTDKPILVLTNGTQLADPDVVDALCQFATTVAVKLDASSEKKLQQMNRPVDGVTLEKIISAAKAFKKVFPGKLSIQTMFMPTNREEVEGIAAVVKAIQPDELQLNTPKRPYPLSWHVVSRGNHLTDHDEKPDYETRQLNVITLEEAEAIETQLRELTGVPVLSVYPK